MSVVVQLFTSNFREEITTDEVYSSHSFCLLIHQSNANVELVFEDGQSVPQTSRGILDFEKAPSGVNETRFKKVSFRTCSYHHNNATFKIIARINNEIVGETRPFKITARKPSEKRKDSPTQACSQSKKPRNKDSQLATSSVNPPPLASSGQQATPFANGQQSHDFEYHLAALRQMALNTDQVAQLAELIHGPSAENGQAESSLASSSPLQSTFEESGAQHPGEPLYLPPHLFESFESFESFEPLKLEPLEPSDDPLGLILGRVLAHDLDSYSSV